MCYGLVLPNESAIAGAGAADRVWSERLADSVSAFNGRAHTEPAESTENDSAGSA